MRIDRICSHLRSASTGRFLASLAGVLLLTTLCHASSPTLANIQPRGAQRGTELDIVLYGDRLADAKEIFWYDEGIAVTKIDVINTNSVKAHVKIAPGARLGEYRLRLRTGTGITELRTFFVGQFPEVAEKKPNGFFDAPQKIATNVTVYGTIDNEQVAYYQIEAKKGQRISAEIEAVRLGITLFDPYIAILDAKRFELAACDDCPLLLQDAFVSVVAPADGKYWIQVRESANGGNGNCQYRLHVGDFPRPTAVYPPGGKAGEEVDFKFLGDIRGDFTQKVKLPANAQEKFPLHVAQDGRFSPSGNVIRVADFPNVMETATNHDQKSAVPSPKPGPVAFNGIISKKEELDWYKFTAKKGEAFDITVFARRLRSPLDPVIHVYNAQGGYIVGNDDALGPDSYLRFGAPADGDYFIMIHDHLKKGGPDWVYRIEVTPVPVSLTLFQPQVAQSSQDRQTVPVPRGNRYATLIQANRVNFGGELVLASENLPKGMTMLCENMAANLPYVPVVFEAAADAPVGGKLANVIGKHADPKVNIKGGIAQSVDLVVAPPNITVYYQATVNQLAAAVTEEAPFKISLVEPKVPLVQNGALNLKVVAERKPGFKAPIATYMLFNPPGVGSSYQVDIPEGKTEALYPINANGGAECRKWKICLIAQAGVKDGPIWVASNLITLEVVPPLVAMKLDMAATQQGKPTEVVCKFTQAAPFEGKAKLQLLGLPAQVTTTDLDITKDSKEAVFKIVTAAGSPVGQHGTLFCQLTVVKNAEPIIHYGGHGGVLRIDAPPPVKKDEPKPAAVVAQAKPQPAAAPAKRLTRLEQLRLEQAERAKAAGGGGN